MQLLAKIRKPRLESFLIHIVNLHLSYAAAEKLRRQFPEFVVFPHRSEAANALGELPEEDLLVLGTPPENAAELKLLLFLSRCVRKAWTAPDVRTRDWRMFGLRAQLFSIYLDLDDPWPDSPPPMVALEQALWYLQAQGRRAKCCGNEYCSAPYFFATRKNQKFCCDECAIPAKREAKLRWWNENRGKGPRK